MGHYDDFYEAQERQETARLVVKIDSVVAAITDAAMLAGQLPKSRESSLVLTKLEEAAMWLQKVRNRG